MNLPGVFEAKKKDGSAYYRASVTYRMKHISLGSFYSEEAAHLAYQEASEILRGGESTLTSYTDKARTLPFEKWVSLINFRDNGLYIANPIYVRKNYFEYYLSPEKPLKFDIDDLFYYSSHKIMARGARLFVSDYGTQTAILSRYGIKPYAVRGRDYEFVNGDELDLRYENVRLKNRFHGVRHVTRKGKPCFQAKIHINGDYVVGTYPTETEAAIAYNKAIDILKKAGLNKNYMPNYVDDVSPSMYAEIYSRIAISKKITSYSPQEG